MSEGQRGMERPVRYVIPRAYYLMTPAFILLDYGAGVSVRAAVLDAMPVYKNLYYGFCVLCGVIVFAVPRASAVVAIVESSIMVFMTAVRVLLPVLVAVGHVDDLSGDWKMAESIGFQGVTNLMMSGTIAVIAFHLNLRSIAEAGGWTGRRKT
jgi:hypothetical protein